MRSQRTIFHEKVDVNLLQCNPHTGALEVGKHDELDVRRGFVVMELVLTGAVGNEAGHKSQPPARSRERI